MNCYIFSNVMYDIDIESSTNQSFPVTFSTKPATDNKCKELMSIVESDIFF